MREVIKFKDFIGKTKGPWLYLKNLSDQVIYKFTYKDKTFFVTWPSLGYPGNVSDPELIHTGMFNTVYKVKEANEEQALFIGFDEGYNIPLINLATGQLAVVRNKEYDFMISKDIEIMELDVTENDYSFKKMTNIYSMDIEASYNNNPLMFMSVYKGDAPAEDAKTPRSDIVWSGGIIEDTTPEVRMVDGSIDLEYYYHNWKKVTNYERTEVLKWLATNDFGYKIALISKQF